MSLAELQDCLDWVAHGFEIVHTHFEGWRFTAADTVADFALHGRLRVGPRVPVQGWTTLAEDLAALRVELLCDGRVVDSGQGAHRARRPAERAAPVDRCDGRAHARLAGAAGDVVTTGTITDAWPHAARASLEHAAERCAPDGADTAHRGLIALHYNH